MSGLRGWPIRFALVSGLGLAAMSCSALSSTYFEAESDLLANRELWRSHDVEDYSASISWASMELRTGVVLVRDGRVVEATTNSGWPVDPGTLILATVEDVFDWIERAIEQRPHRVRVEYDADYGFPVRASLDFEESAIDDEVRVMIVDFATPGEAPALAADYLEIQRRDLREPLLFGRVRAQHLDGYELTELTADSFEVGPMTLELLNGPSAGMQVLVAPGTVAYGTPCRRVLPETDRARGTDGPHPCWVQIGLTPDAVSAAWIRVMNVAEPSTPYVTGRIVEFLGPYMILDDGTVIPIGLDRRDRSCAEFKGEAILGVLVEIQIHPQTGEADLISCPE